MRYKVIVSDALRCFSTAPRARRAHRFPQNANVTAAIGLAGIGLDDTRVTLEADPHSTVNEHYIAVNGPFGSMNIALSGNPLPDNPKQPLPRA